MFSVRLDSDTEAGKGSILLSHYCCCNINHMQLFFITETCVALEEEFRIFQGSALALAWEMEWELVSGR